MTFRPCLALLLLASFPAWAYETEWVVPMGGNGMDYAFSVVPGADGHTYACGSFQDLATFGSHTLTGAGFGEAFVTKLAANASVLWAKSMGGAGDDDARSLGLDANGNVYVIGSFEGTATFGPYALTSEANTRDIFVAKLDADGNVLWARKMGGSSEDEGFGVAIDPAGNPLVTGFFQGTAAFGPYTLSSSASSFDVFVAKLDANGDALWAKSMGGANEDWPFGIAVDAAGNAYVTGRFVGTANYGPYVLIAAGSWDVFVESLDADGSVRWAKRMGGTGADFGWGIAVDPSGNSYVTGEFSATATFGTFSHTSAGSQDAFVEKLDASGSVLWARRMGSTGLDWGNDVAVDATGHAYVTGRFEDTVAFGDYTLVSSGGTGDLFIEKLDANGSVLWATGMGGIREDRGFSVAVDALGGDAFVSGRFGGRSRIGYPTLVAAGPWDGFVAKLAPCASPVPQNTYGTLLFPPACARNASGLALDVYGSRTLTLQRGALDRLFLSSDRDRFSPLAVDDAVRIDGVDSGLGPYTYRPGVPPFALDAPIEESLVPLPAHEVTSVFAVGRSTVQFELLETDGQVYGNTAVYLVRDCGLWLEGTGPTYLYWVTHDDQVSGTPPDFDVRFGLLSELRVDGNFARAQCLDRFAASPAVENFPAPTPDDGYYYLVRGVSSCIAQGHGDSSLTPDPRDALDASPVCP